MKVTRQPGFIVKGTQIENRVQKAFVFNEAGDDLDFRIEGATDENLFFLDAGNDRIGFGTSTPDAKFHVVGGGFQVSDAESETKAFRTRFGGSTDYEFAGAHAYFSVWDNANFSGSQRYKMLMRVSENRTDAIQKWVFVEGAFGAEHIILNAEASQTGDCFVFNENGEDRDFRIEGDTDTHMFFGDAGSDAVGIGHNTPAGKLHIDQNSATGAKPVLVLDQGDLSEEFIKLIGQSTTDNSQSLVDAADLATPGSIVGWFKISVQDDQATNPIADGVYYVPFYSTPTA